MAKSKDILGMNERNLKYIKPLNRRRAIRLADSKLKTSRIFKKNGLPVPKMYAVLKNAKEVEEFNWDSLLDSFVVKPNSGLGGGGIIVIKGKKQLFEVEEDRRKKIHKKAFIDKSKDFLKLGSRFLVDESEICWEAIDGDIWTIERLRSHCYDIIDGRFSITGRPDIALIQQRLIIHPALRYYTYRGMPDVRVIVYNNVPVMAMLRLPTKISNGKANLAQGAVGVGIDLATGLTTTSSIKKPRRMFVDKHPDTKRDLSAIEIPFWDEILKMAIKAQEVSELGFLAVDIAIDKNKGPVILEVNARGGLEIQNVNLAALGKRLDRVEGLKIKSISHGVRVAKALFGGEIERKVEDITGKQVLGIVESVKIVDKEGELHSVLAKIDTGAGLTSIDVSLAKKLGFQDAMEVFERYNDINRHLKREEAKRLARELKEKLKKEHQDIVDTAIIHSASGTTWRIMVPLSFYISGVKVDTKASVIERKNLKYPMIIGRKDLKDFLVDPEKKLEKVKKI